MQHERRPCGEKSLPSFWGKKGGILKRLSFGVQRHVITSTRALARPASHEPRASMPLDLSDDSSSEDDDERRLGGGDASTSSIAQLRARLRLEKKEENNKKWKRWRTTRGDDATRTTKIRRRASDAETSHRYVIGGERPIDGGDEDDENVFVE